MTVNSLVIMITYNCQLQCDYCEVAKKRSSISKKTLRQSIDLLFTSSSQHLQLRFFGGEPLLRPDLIKDAISYAEKMACEKNKKIKFMITTNGLLLDKKMLIFFKKHNIEIMFSIDGPQNTNNTHRLSGGRSDEIYVLINKNLKRVIKSGVKYFVNMVVTPKTVHALSDSLAFFVAINVERLQLCYRGGIIWPKNKILAMISGLKNFLLANSVSFLMNLENNCEPTILSQEIIVDVEGKVYFDAAIFMENVFPRLRNDYFVGIVNDLKNIDNLYKSKSQLYRIFKKSCSLGQKKIFINNLKLGIRLGNFFKTFDNSYRKSVECYEHPALIPIIRGGFLEQQKILKKIGINAFYLYIDGPCFNNCIFCKQKTDKFSNLQEIELKLSDNLSIKAKKLCIIGNDPLLHPNILNILSLVKKYGFSEIEVMTSGELLADKRFVLKLKKLNIKTFSTPLFGPNAKIHDSIVGQKGSFKRVFSGINNILSANMKVFIHTNLLRKNINHINDLEKIIREELRLPFVILPIRPKNSNVPFQKLVPSFKEFKKLKGINSLLGFPLCLMVKIQEEIFKNESEISDSMKLYFLDQKFSKIDRCEGCRYNNECSGFFSETPKSDLLFIRPFRH